MEIQRKRRTKGVDWQVIILTLGAALITGLTSVVGNILAVRSSIRKGVLENKEQKEKEFMSNRINAYSNILVILRDINESLSENELSVKCTQLENKWLVNYPYLSLKINRDLHILTECLETKNTNSLNFRIMNIREKIKEEIDEYYNIRDKDDFEIGSGQIRHIKYKSKRKLK